MKYYLSLGTNLGRKEQNLQAALKCIEEQIGNIISLSAFHVTAPWSFTSANSFLNAACCVQTGLTPLQMLQATQRIERQLGRTHKSVNRIYADRLIDIDLLLCFTDEGTPLTLNTPALTLPHPLMRERDFVMTPLREILPTV